MTADWQTTYRGRRALVTGHTGFKGGWLTTWLCELGATVTGYSLPPPTTPNLFTAASVGRRIEHIDGDIRDAERLSALVLRTRPDVVFHLAAQPIVRESYRDPLGTFSSNVMGTTHLLEAVRTAGRPVAVVIATSDKCYENRETVYAYREEDRLGGHDPYSASKAAAELVAASYRDSFFPADDVDRHGIRVATVRAGNVIGGGDWARDRVVPDCVRAIGRGESIAVRRPRAIRPWQHVLDPLAGYLMLGARLLEGAASRRPFMGAWNFGPDADDVRTVGDLVEAFVASYGVGRWHQTSSDGPHEATLLRLANDKARRELGWAPRLRFARAVELTASWYRELAEGRPGAELCARQIAAFVTCETV